MTSKFYSAVLAGTAVLAVTLGATSANAATASAGASAKIVGALTVTKQTDLAFGTIISGATAGTVAVAPAGTVVCAVALTCSGTTSAAVWNVNGTSGEFVSVSGAPTSITLNGPAGATMTVGSIGFNNGTNLAMTGSNVALQMGGTLSVGANQAAGQYSNTFNLNVNYN